jgi:hypothetical protein
VMNALNNYVSLHLHLLARRTGCLELHPAGDRPCWQVDQRSRSLPNRTQVSALSPFIYAI